MELKNNKEVSNNIYNNSVLKIQKPIHDKVMSTKYFKRKNNIKKIDNTKPQSFLISSIDGISKIFAKDAFFKNLKELSIFIDLSSYSNNNREIEKFVINNYKEVSALIDILKKARKIFGNRELILKKNDELEDSVNLIVRQNNYSEDETDILDDLIYELIKFNSKLFVKNQMKCSIIPNTDYKSPEYINGRVKTI